MIRSHETESLTKQMLKNKIRKKMNFTKGSKKIESEKKAFIRG
jgi:hypothetical protein